MRISLPVLALKLPDRTAMGGALTSCRRRLLRNALAYFTICAALLVPSVARAGWVDGGFESGAFAPNWHVSSYYNNSVPTFPPTKKSDLGLAVTTDNGLSSVVPSGSDAQANNALSYPKWGNKAGLLNMGGNNNRVSAIDQTVTMAAADVDPADGKVHVRFAIAPVLEDPGHSPEQQPYYFVEVTNVSKGTQLFYNYHYANQSGVPWKKGSSDYLYTDWQAFDIAPGNGILDVGDQVKLEIISAGCSPGAHEAHLYVDGIGSLFEGLRVTATGPSTAATGSDITYTYTYTNNSANAAANTVIDAVMPQDMTSPPLNATFVSDVPPPGGTCTDPGVGNAGTVSCTVGTLNSHASGSFQVTVHIPANASVSAPNQYLNNGNYSIRATGASPFLGPLFQTQLLAPSTSFTLSLAKAGSGVGSVVSAPAGIVCGTDCPAATMLVPNGSQVSLTASTTAGNTFAGWSGACSGTGACSVTMDAAKSVTASFNKTTSSSTVILEEFNGSTSVGSAHGLTYESSPYGTAARFARTAESRVQFPFSVGLPTSGTIEALVKIDSAYYYDNYALSTNNDCALVFTTDVQGGDVYWPGSAWFNVCKNGDVSLNIATTKFGASPPQTLSATGTAFRFGEWHSVGFSYGSGGQALMVDRVQVANAPANTVLLGSGGTHSSPVDVPTLGESVPGFWANNQYDGGFEGVVDTFRASTAARDWTLIPKPATASQSIAFGNAPSVTVGGTGTVSATASSGLAVTFSSTTTGICTVSGSTVTGIAAGTCIVAANQAGNSSFSAAPQVTQSFSVNKVAQSISFGAAPSVTVGGSGTVSATASSGLAVTFSSMTTGICTVSGSTVSGSTVSGSTVSGSTVSGVAAGTCTIATDQAGNASYSAAPQVTQSFSVTAVSGTNCSTSAFPFSLCDEFSGTAVNTSVWKQVSNVGDNTGNSSSVHDGYLDLREDTTDNGGAVVTRFAPQKRLRVTLTHNMHSGGEYFYPAIYLESAVGKVLVALTWMRTAWGASNCNQASRFDRVNLQVGITGSCESENILSSMTSSSFYDRWSTAVFDYDMETGLVTVDLDNDGTIDLQAIVPSASRQPVTGVFMSANGWWTGHWHRVDAIKIEGNPATLSRIFFEDFNGSTNLDSAKWTVTPLNTQAHPATISFSGGRMNVDVPGGSSGYMGVFDGSVFTPSGATVTDDYEVTIGIEELLRQQIGGYKDNSGIALIAGDRSISINGNYSGYFTGYSYNTYNKHFILGNGPAGHCVLDESLGLSTLYAVELRIARSAGNVTISYRLAGNPWVSTPCGTQTGAVLPYFEVTSGDGGNTLQNGKFIAAIDYFQVLSGVSTLASQTITFSSTAPTVTVGGTGSVSATATSGLPVTLTSLTTPICTVAGSTVTGVAAGICTLAANQAGNSTYAAAPQATLSFSIAASIVPPGPPTITSIKAGSGSATLNFSAPGNTGGSPIASYTASCTATGQTTRTATGTASPLTVRNLTGGVVYQCSLTATNGGGFSSTASAAMAVTAKKSSMTPILMLLLD